MTNGLPNPAFLERWRPLKMNATLRSIGVRPRVSWPTLSCSDVRPFLSNGKALGDRAGFPQTYPHEVVTGLTSFFEPNENQINRGA